MSSIKHHVTGQQYWRSLEQLAGTSRVAELLDQEFPGYDADTIAGTSRRSFMKLMGAALALAGLTLNGCRRWPKEELAPYSSNPRGVTPGVPDRYATTFEMNGVAQGLLVTAYDGRPIKIEGNPTHPASQVAKPTDTFPGYGSADAFAQASLLEMYDPERSRFVVERGQDKAQQHPSWEAFLAAARTLVSDLKGTQGYGFAILSEATSSPTVMAQRKAVLEAFPKARWYEYEPLSRDNEREGAKLAFGKVLRAVLKLDKADIIVSLDADLLLEHPNHTRYANDWANNRRSADAPEAKDKTMNRVHIAESGLSVTGSVADARIGVAPNRIYALAHAIAAKLGVVGIGEEKLNDDAEKSFVEKAAADLKEARGRGVVAVGPTAPPAAHAVAHAINSQLGAVGSTVYYIDEIDADRPTHFQAITDLTAGLNSGAVTALLILGGNPVYDAPADLRFAAALAAAHARPVPATTIHLSLYDNETSHAVKWHLPRAHYLESWGDAVSWDGTVTLQQPLILPLFGGKTPAEVLAIVLGEASADGQAILRMTHGSPDPKSEESVAFEKNFRRALEAGFVEGSAPKPVEAPMKLENLPAVSGAGGDFTLCFTADSHVYDGRFANNGWLQETPDPLSKLMWDNALLLSVKDARDPKLDLDNDDEVELTLPGGATLKVPVMLMPGQPKGVVSLALGYGRDASAGPIAEGVGFNAYGLRSSQSPWSVDGVKIRKTGGSYHLVASAEHHLLDHPERDAERYRVGNKNESGHIIREATLDEYKQPDNKDDLGAKVRTIPLQLFQPPTKDNFRDLHAWGMTIDLAACIGCNACAVACQAENNIPVVGKEQCDRHREMNWIRIDRYFKGDIETEEPEIVFQPMTCQHCENAPCEQVCPVAATVHDAEGLNTMVYNRCIGTRYCSNNCPYKVRRFNYFDFHSQDPRSTSKWLKNPYLNLPDMEQQDPAKYNEIKRMVFNPEVTVRMRGVMEKCTYCVQRIHTTVIAKRGQGSDVQDGDIITACQQACPTQAIVFGNLMDENSQVSKLQQNPRAFDVLHDELNTRPRTRYLAKLRNPSV